MERVLTLSFHASFLTYRLSLTNLLNSSAGSVICANKVNMAEDVVILAKVVDVGNLPHLLVNLARDVGSLPKLLVNMDVKNNNFNMDWRDLDLADCSKICFTNSSKTVEELGKEMAKELHLKTSYPSMVMGIPTMTFGTTTRLNSRPNEAE